MARDPLFDDDDQSGADPARAIPGDGGAQESAGGKRGFFRRAFGWIGGLFRKKPETHPAEKSRLVTTLKWGFLILFGVAILYYPVGMAVMHRVGDDVDFTVEFQEGQSRSVAITAALIEREVMIHNWLPNDPFFMPSWMLDNGPNFQRGMIAALARFTVEMQDKIGRVRGSSSVDEDLEKAAGDIRYSPNIWVVSSESSTLVTQSSESKYRAARRSLLRYNQRLAAGEAVFDARADNLQTLIDRINADIGSQSAIIEQHVRQRGGDFFDTTADNIFYETKGRLYGYYMVLREVGHDFRDVIEEKRMQPIWDEMMQTMRAAAELQPLIVRNGAPDGLLQPNHLMTQGFYLLRARTQLKEISDILLR